MQNPKLIPVPFANSGIKDDIPKVKSTSMSDEKASWETGFPEATMLPVYAGGLPPDGKDFNGVLNQISENLVFQSKGGRYKFDPDFAISIGGYPKGATLQTNDESAEYQSLIDNNLVNFNTATPEEIAQAWRITGLGDAIEVLNGKFDKASVKNELGLSQTEVVSQKVVTELGSGIVGSFENGLNFIGELTNSDQQVTLENEFGKQPYYWDGDLPKQVPAGSIPQSTGGIGKGAWVSVGDASLRGNLRSEDGLSFIGETNYEGVRNYTGSNSKIGVYGISNVFDGGNGVFILDPSDSASEDNNATILVDSLDRRWKRQLNGIVNAKWFGVTYDGVDREKEINALFEYCSKEFVECYLEGWVSVKNGVTLSENLKLTGIGKNKSGLRYIGVGGENSFVAKNSKYEIGENPQTGTQWNKLVSLSSVGFDANHIADFGLYTVGALFFDYRSVWALRAKKISNFFGWSFSSYANDISGSDSTDIGFSLGYDYFEWGGPQKAECNAILFDRVMCYGNGLSNEYNKDSGLRKGSGAVVGRTIGCAINVMQLEQNKGVGLFVEAECKTSFNNVYLEANAIDGTGTNYQVYNNSISAAFTNIIPQFNASDVFYAAVKTVINSWQGQRVVGEGYVTLDGDFRNATVQTLNKIDIKLGEAQHYDSSSAPVVKVNMTSVSPDSSSQFFRTKIYNMGFFIAFRAPVTINSGLVIVMMDAVGNRIKDYAVPAGSYVNGDLLEIVINEDLSKHKSITWRLGGSLQNIGLPDIGFYARLIV